MFYEHEKVCHKIRIWKLDEQYLIFKLSSWITLVQSLKGGPYQHENLVGIVGLCRLDFHTEVGKQFVC